MPTTELTALTLTAAARLVLARDVSAVELTTAHLRRIELVDPLLNSFITVTAEHALQAAAAADAALAHGQVLGPLHGLPLAIKDLFETAGIRTTAGSSFLRDYVPRADATVVARLAAAGAVSLGKLNMHEWAMSVTNNNPFYGPCRNPWDVNRIPGGSSGGSGAALAAGLCLGALGSDTGGSIRIPAALCGVVGLKPTTGRVSSRGALPLSWNLDHAGPMARRVRDVAVLLQVIAGYDPADPYAVDRPVDDYLAGLDQGVKGWRVALAFDHFYPADRTVDPAIRPLVRAAAQVLVDLGATVEEIELPETGGAANSTILRGDAAAYHRERFAAQPDGFGADVREMLTHAGQQRAVDYALARQTQTRLRREFTQLFAHYDLLLTPATATTAHAINEPAAEAAQRVSLVSYTAPFNLTGLPALALPCGFSAAGLPVGLQLVGRPWAEAALLRAGAAYEAATPWHQRQPPPVVLATE